MKQKELPFPVELSASQSELEGRYQPLQFAAIDDPTWRFVIAVPKGWEVVRTEDAPPDADTPVRTLLLAQSPDECEIEVFSAILDREMHAADWVQVVLEARGHTILKQRRLPTEFGDAGDFLTETEDESGTIISRLFAIKDHHRLFVVHGRSRLRLYPRESDHFLVAIKSLRLLKPTSIISAEPLKEMQISRPMYCHFQVPQRWQYKEKPPSEGGVSFELQDIDDEHVIGSIQVTTLHPKEAKDPAEFSRQFCDQLRDRGFSIEITGQLRLNPPNGFLHGLLYRLTGTRNEATIDTKCAAFRHEAGWLVIAAIGVGPETQREVWSLHDRAFGIVLQTLTTSGQ